MRPTGCWPRSARWEETGGRGDVGDRPGPKRRRRACQVIQEMPKRQDARREVACVGWAKLVFGKGRERVASRTTEKSEQ